MLTEKQVLNIIKKVLKGNRDKKKPSFADQIMKNKKYQYPSKPTGDMKNSSYNDSWWMG